MKKLSILMLAALMLLSMTACTKNKTPAPTEPSVTTPPATTPPATQPATVPPTEAPMDPTLETNIPDTDIGPTLPDMDMDMTEGGDNANDGTNGGSVNGTN